MVRFTPNGLSVRSRHLAISLARSAGVGWVSAVIMPSAPALATAATSSARPTHCIPPCTIGCSMPNVSVKRVLKIACPHFAAALGPHFSVARTAARCWQAGCRPDRQKSILHGRWAHAEREGEGAEFSRALAPAGLLSKFVRQFADTVDRDGDGIDGVLHHADADRGAASDEVARQQRHVVRDFADELLRAEDHVGDRIILPLLAIEDGA